MNYFLTLIFGLSFLSCNNEIEKLKTENLELIQQVELLNTKIDSLENLPSLVFEKIISKDISLDSLRNKSNSEFISLLQDNNLKTNDSLLTEEYLDFAKENQNSYFSMYAIDRVKSIGNKQRVLKVNQIVGEWNWESITNTWLPDKIKKNEKIVFNKNKSVKFFKDEDLVSEEKFDFLRRDFFGQHIKFSRRGVYTISIKENGLMTLTKGLGYCIDCGTDIFKKVQ